MIAIVVEGGKAYLQLKRDLLVESPVSLRDLMWALKHICGEYVCYSKRSEGLRDIYEFDRYFYSEVRRLLYYAALRAAGLRHRDAVAKAVSLGVAADPIYNIAVELFTEAKWRNYPDYKVFEHLGKMLLSLADAWDTVQSISNPPSGQMPCV